jgi:hypothetical protein
MGLFEYTRQKKISFSPLAWTVVGIWAEYLSIRHMGAFKEALEYSEKAKNLIDEGIFLQLWPDSQWGQESGRMKNNGGCRS